MVESEKYWPGWFEKLSSEFLASPAARVLVLAGMALTTMWQFHHCVSITVACFVASVRTASLQ